MTELRWLLSRKQVDGAFCQQLQIDGADAFIRLQFRENTGMVALAAHANWAEVPVMTEIPEAPRIQLASRGRPN